MAKTATRSKVYERAPLTFAALPQRDHRRVAQPGVLASSTREPLSSHEPRKTSLNRLALLSIQDWLGTDAALLTSMENRGSPTKDVADRKSYVADVLDAIERAEAVANNLERITGNCKF